MPGAPAAPNASAPPIAASWLPRQVAELRALDKVRAGSVPIVLRVGQSVNFGSLTITLRGCLVRPSDQPVDAAAFLDIVDNRPGGPGFRGWMFASAPQLAMLEHPIYDVRLLACHD
jgi:hypothetical protein